MPKLLEELWYGNIYPSEQIKRNDPEIKDLLRLTAKNRDKLTDTLTEQQKELLEKYDDRMHELYAMFEREVFMHGFKMGAKLLAEVLVEDATE